MPCTKKELIYSDLSYKIIGILFDVYNKIGSGHHEKYYQKAIAKTLKRFQFKFAEQVKADLTYNGEKLGNYFLDFLIENKIILEIKRGDYFPSHYYNQVNAYLKTTGLKLAILANFTTNGVKIKRMVNLQ